MKSFKVVFAVVATSMSFLVACGGDDPKLEGEPCTVDSDCADGLLCLENADGDLVCTMQGGNGGSGGGGNPSAGNGGEPPVGGSGGNGGSTAGAGGSTAGAGGMGVGGSDASMPAGGQDAGPDDVDAGVDGG